MTNMYNGNKVVVNIKPISNIAWLILYIMKLKKDKIINKLGILRFVYNGFKIILF